MNSVGSDITNRFVLVSAKSLKPEFADAPLRVFFATGGFGASPETIGAAVFGEYVNDAEECRVEGYDLEDRFATLDEVRAAFALRDAAMTEKMEKAFAELEPA